MCTSATTQTDRPQPLAAIVSCQLELTGFCYLVDYQFDDVVRTGTMYVCMCDAGCMVVKMRFKGYRDSNGIVYAAPSDVELMHTVQDIEPSLFNDII